MKKNDILLLFYSLKSGSSCQYIGTEQLRDSRGKLITQTRDFKKIRIGVGVVSFRRLCVTNMTWSELPDANSFL